MPKVKTLLAFFLTLLLSGCYFIPTKTTTSNLPEILKEFHNPNSKKILVAAHRAMHTKYPENSLDAYKHSIENGIDIIETDIRTTKDGKLILLHDSTIDRITNGRGNVTDYTYAELQKFDLYDRYGTGRTFKIPLVENAFKIAKDKIMLDLDLKDVSIKQLVNLVHKTNMEEQVIFFDSDFAVLDSVLLMDSTLILMPRAHSLDETNKIINRYHPEVIHIDKSFYSKEVVDIIKKSGARVWINALGKTDIEAFGGNVDKAYGELLKGGANIIQTDLPLILKTYLDKNNFR